MPLWIASGNPAKSKELIDFAVRFFPEWFPVIAREPRGVVESEPTYFGNANLKVEALVKELLDEGHKNFAVIGDDSGLSVDLLDGKPGIHSARYAGPNANSQKNLKKLLHELKLVSSEVNRRTGKYHCALSLILVSEGKVKVRLNAEGTRDGLIGLEPKGINGYAYDSVFLDPKTLQSYAEVSYEEKQIDSHRCRAFKNLQSVVQRT